VLGDVERQAGLADARTAATMMRSLAWKPVVSVSSRGSPRDADDLAAMGVQ